MAPRVTTTTAGDESDELDDDEHAMLPDNLDEEKSSFGKSHSSDEMINYGSVESIKSDRNNSCNKNSIAEEEVENYSTSQEILAYNLTTTNETNTEEDNDKDLAAPIIRPPPKILKKPFDYSCLFKPGEIPDNILNLNRSDPLPCIEKQQKALSALTLLSNLHKMLQKPLRPASLFLANIMHHLETTENDHTTKARKSFFTKWKIYKYKKLNQVRAFIRFFIMSP